MFVARVNGRSITREELARRCLARYGAKELETLIGLTIVEGASESRGIKVTDDEIQTEVGRIARELGLTTDDWYRKLEKDRGISKDQYNHDIVYTNLLLMKLGGDSELGLTYQELKRKAEIEVFFGPPVRRNAEAPLTHERSQEDRLRFLERKLDEVLKSLESLKGARPPARS